MTEIDKLYAELDETYEALDDALTAVIALCHVVERLSDMAPPEPEYSMVVSNLAKCRRRRSKAQGNRALYGQRN